MSLVHVHNISDSEILSTAKRISPGEIPTHAYMQLVYGRHDNNWRFLIGRCVLLKTEAPEMEDYFMEYAFILKKLPVFSLANFLKKFSGDGIPISDQVPHLSKEKRDSHWSAEIVPSNMGFQGLPNRRFTIKIENNAHFMDGRLMAHGKTYYGSAHKYLSDFLDHPDLLLHNDARIGTFTIEIPDVRGKIIIDNDQLSFIQKRGMSLNLVGQINNGPSISLTRQETVAINEDNLTGVELWLLSRRNEIIDYRSTSEWPYKYTYDEREIDPTHQYLELIQRGESQHCEFKKYIRLHNNKDDKAIEIEKTVSAFSNQDGGHLFIGVNDEGDIVGLDPFVREDYQRNLNDALDCYVSDIRKRLIEQLRDAQSTDVIVITLLDVKVLLITVYETSEINSIKNGKEAYIRRGATNHKMEAEEIEKRLKYRDYRSLGF